MKGEPSRNDPERAPTADAGQSIGRHEVVSVRVGEIPEAAAAGTVAAVYADIRRVLGVSFVPLVYRVLACESDRLEGIWADVAPNLGDEITVRAAGKLGATPASSAAGRPPESDLSDARTAAAVATIGAYRRSNALNLIGLSALGDGISAPRASAPVPSARPRSRSILPMADLAVLPRSTIALLEEMSAPIAGAERPIVIPSLFRHFAHDERLLADIWTAIRPQVATPDFANATSAIRVEARAIASSLPYRIARVENENTRRIVERFIATISAMIVAGGLLEAAISHPTRRDGVGD